MWHAAARMLVPYPVTWRPPIHPQTGELITGVPVGSLDDAWVIQTACYRIRIGALR